MSKKRPSQTTQPTISSFFSQNSTPSRPKALSKRGSTPIDLTIDSDDGDHPPPPKRQKKNSGTSTFFTPRKDAPSSPKSVTQPSRSAGHAEQWRFDPSSPTRATQPTSSENGRATHERAKRILLGGDGLFSHAARSRGATPAGDGQEGPAESDGEQSADEGDEAEKKFGELMEMFSSSNSKAKKGRATGRKAAAAPVAGPSRPRVQKVVELGPSGKAYTPFELQVSAYPEGVHCPAFTFSGARTQG